MVFNISVLGSCASRSIFNSNINNLDYKKMIKINTSVEQTTLISLMSKKFSFDKKKLDSSHEYDNYCVGYDLSKDFLVFLKNNSLDYLIMDTYWDVEDTVSLVNDGCYITNSNRLHQTSLVDTIKFKNNINIKKNFDEYLKLWIDSCNRFFDFLNKYTDVKVILNCSRGVYKCDDGGIITEDLYLKTKCKNHNKYKLILDNYILNNFDVEVLTFNNYYFDKNHFFGLHPTHYESKFYVDKTLEINQICLRNELLNKYSLDKVNHSIKKLRRVNAIG